MATLDTYMKEAMHYSDLRAALNYLIGAYRSKGAIPVRTIEAVLEAVAQDLYFTDALDVARDAVRDTNEFLSRKAYRQAIIEMMPDGAEYDPETNTITGDISPEEAIDIFAAAQEAADECMDSLSDEDG